MSEGFCNCTGVNDTKTTAGLVWRKTLYAFTNSIRASDPDQYLNHLDCGVSNETTNPCPEWINRFL